jgi:hypothetical protein
VIDERVPGTEEAETDEPSIFGDLKGEDEKLAQALEMAFNEISKDKSEGVDEETAAANT